MSVQELASLLTQAGFEMKTIETRPNVRHQLTAEAAIRFSEASSLGNFLGHLREELRALAREDIRRELEQTGPLAGTSSDRFLSWRSPSNLEFRIPTILNSEPVDKWVETHPGIPCPGNPHSPPPLKSGSVRLLSGQTVPIPVDGAARASYRFHITIRGGL